MNNSAWSSLHKTNNTLCTAPDDACCDLIYMMGAESLNKIQSWVDAAYAFHPDMKSHTGGITSFGLGGFMGKSIKQKLNTKSSTEAELIGASDYLPNTMWLKLFLGGTESQNG